LRMVFALTVMVAIALIAGARWPRGPEIGHSLAAGAIMHGLTLGGAFTAISQGLPAGIAALIPGLQPILTSTLANRFMGEKVSPLQWVGLTLGLVGVVMVLHTATSWRKARRSGGSRASYRSSVSRSARCIRSV